MSTQPDLSSGSAPWPDLDDRLAEPETRFEVIDGVPVYVPPSHPPHAHRHTTATVVIQTHLAEGHRVLVDALTRVSPVDDIAPDVIVDDPTPDPETGGRRVPELALEVASSQTLPNAAKKARLLTARGVRRVFAIRVRAERLFEWSAADDDWVELPADSAIEDRVFATPVPVKALTSSIDPDEPVVRAMLVKKHRLLREHEDRIRREAEAIGEAKGEAKGEARANAVARSAVITQIRRMLRERVHVSERVDRALAEEQSIPTLTRWAIRSVSCATADQLIDE